MSSNSILGSVNSQKMWALEMDKNFTPEHTVDIDFDTTTCVFRVPKSLSETKPEAYVPRDLGLGPYHHARPEFYVKQKEKVSAVRRFLGAEKLQNFNKVVEALIQWEPVVRACYDQYLDLDTETLARILAIDALYLLQLFEPSGEVAVLRYSCNGITYTVEKKIPGQMEKFAGDIIMLENQIPVILLKKIQQVLQLEEVVEQDYADHALFREFQKFCEAYSPLKLNQQTRITEDKTQLHLLHRLYYLIVTNRGINDADELSFADSMTVMGPACMPDVSITDDVSPLLHFLAQRGMPGAETVWKALSFIQKLPLDRILALFKKGGPDQQIPSVEEIDIPTVSQMNDAAGIRFRRTSGGIRDIKYVDHDEDGQKVLYLPSIRLVDANSELILRNLVAYEAASAKPGSPLELAEYVDLMCGIINTTKDVDILKKADIIEGELPDEEIARIFNGIKKSSKKNDKKSNIEQAIDNVNESYHSVGRVKVKEFLKKYFYASLKFLSVLITVAVLVLLSLQAFCSAFGCGRWFGKGTTMQIHNLFFSDL